MIREVNGDILLTRAQAIAHGVAPDDDFGTGLAHALRERFPAMYKDFRHFCHTNHPKTGEAWTWGGPDHRIVALLTQEPPERHHVHPGKASVASVNHALKSLRETIVSEKYTSVALPRLATGYGGLDWDDVKPLIEHHLGDLGVPVWVYATYTPGKQAIEHD
jgi:O-acetyl-ADP-ribose deacetylase (regulator of RNase III)